MVMEWLNDFAPILAVFATLLGAAAVFIGNRQSNKYNKLEGKINRNHERLLADLNDVRSRQQYINNKNYTRNANYLERAANLIGDINYWAEKCVVSRTTLDFGEPKTAAKKMSSAIEALFKLQMNYPYAFKGIKKFDTQIGDLMASVNNIVNKLNQPDYDKNSAALQETVKEFQGKLSPLISNLQKELDSFMSMPATKPSNPAAPTT